MSAKFLASLVQRSPEEVIWIDSQSNPICLSDVQNFKNVNRSLLTRATNQNIAILLDNSAYISQLLFALDGVCKRLFIVPKDISPALLPELLSIAQINLLVTDKQVEALDENIEIATINQDAQSDLITADKLRPLETEWIIATSGTTGVPKLLVHSLAELSGSVKRNTAKGQEFTWGLMYDLSKYAGLQVYLQSLLGGSCLLIPDQQLSLDKQIAFLAKNKCNALSATPTLWRKILMSPHSRKLALRQITLGGEIVDQSILNALDKHFANAKIAHIYASTEAGVGFSVTDKLAGFPEDFLTDGPQNVSLKVVDNRLFIKSEKTASRQLNNPGLKDYDDYVDTGDMLSYHNNRYFFLGRASGLINVGGNKVHPEEVEQHLLSHEAVKMAYVYAKTSHLMGSLVACDLVIDDSSEKDSQALKKQIRTFCSQSMPQWKVPALIKFVDNIDVSLSGKQVRK